MLGKCWRGPFFASALPLHLFICFSVLMEEGSGCSSLSLSPFFLPASLPLAPLHIDSPGGVDMSGKAFVPAPLNRNLAIVKGTAITSGSFSLTLPSWKKKKKIHCLFLLAPVELQFTVTLSKAVVTVLRATVQIFCGGLLSFMVPSTYTLITTCSGSASMGFCGAFVIAEIMAD